MPVNPLFSCRVKIDRAHQHLRDLKLAIEAFSGRNPNPIMTDEDSEPAIKIDIFSVRENIPTDFSAYIGDIAHNAVSALDSLAFALVQHGGVEPLPLTEEVMRDTYFPISWKPSFPGRKFTDFFRRIGPSAEKMIHYLEPYKGGRANDLFRLWRLNNIDKHRAVVPVAADLLGVQFRLPGEIEPLPPREAARKPRFPLKHGDELSRRAFHEPEYNANAHFMFQIAFGEGQIFEGDPVIETLEEMIQLVESVIYAFAFDIFGQDFF
jgi:hypothetical protein